MMSLVQACALVEQAIKRARSLVTPNASPAGVVLGDIDDAAASTSASARMTDGSEGSTVAAHKRFADDSTAVLSSAGHADRSLQTHLIAAASLTHEGAQRLDAIAERTRVTARAVAGAMSPAAQRVVLTALRLQLAKATEVVNSVDHQGAELTGRIRSLRYEPPTTRLQREPQFPAGPTVWCVRPKGVFGFYRCSVLYPDLSVGTYWSPTDDTGGS